MEIILNAANTALLDAWSNARRLRLNAEKELEECKGREHATARNLAVALCPKDANPDEVFTMPIGDGYLHIKAPGDFNVADNNRAVWWRNESEPLRK